MILGSGNVSFALVDALKRLPGTGDEVKLVQICSRNREEGKKLADRAGVPYTDSPEDLAEADLYILAISDGAVGEIAGRMKVPQDAVVVHTGGSISIDALPARIPNRGVIYPLQTFTKGREVDFRDIPVFIEYSTPRAGQIIRYVVDKLSGKVSEASSEQRKKLHLAAVFAGNFTNHMYVIASDILKEAGLQFEIVKPLIKETASKAVASDSPEKAQTGPAVRGDKETIRRHILLLQEAEGTGNKTIKDLREDIYEKISQSIWETSKRK